MKQQNPSTKPKNEGYGRKGVSVADLDSDDCLAKKVVGPRGNESYYLRFGSEGVQAGMLYDFNSPIQEHRSRQDRRRGIGRFEFRKVTKESFAAYVRYLKTENHAHLRTAQREVML